MRRAANENPLVRVVLLGVLALAFVLLLYSRVLSEKEESAPPEAEPAASATAAEAGSAPVTSTSTPGSPETPAPQDVGPIGGAAAADAVPPQALVPGKGLPAPVIKAYADGKTVALLVIKRRGIDDRKLRRAIAPINRRGDAGVFIVRAKHIARYSRITLGVNVSRVPALVIVGPREGNEAPLASVSYGFRGARSASQAVRDALYDGGEAPYFPE